MKTGQVTRKGLEELGLINVYVDCTDLARE